MVLAPQEQTTTSTHSNRAMALPHVADADLSVALGARLRSQFYTCQLEGLPQCLSGALL